MGADAGDLAVIQHHDLLGAHDRAHALGDDQHGGLAGSFLRAFSRRIGPEIQGRKAVVEDVDLRLLGQGAGDGKPLFLAAGEVGAALRYRSLVALLAGGDEVKGLGRFSVLGHLGVGRLFVGVPDVAVDCAGEEHRLLRDIAYLVSQVMLRDIAHVHAVDQDLPSVAS